MTVAPYSVLWRLRVRLPLSLESLPRGPKSRKVKIRIRLVRPNSEDFDPGRANLESQLTQYAAARARRYCGLAFQSTIRK